MYADSGRNKKIKNKKLTPFILEKRILCQDNVPRQQQQNFCKNDIRTVKSNVKSF